MAEDYRINLGIDLDDKQLNAVKTTINNLVDKERKINLDIDFNIKNANKLSDVGREIEDIKKSLKELNNVGSVGKGKSPISIDSKSLETSLNKIHDTIKKLQNAFGRVDKNKGVQSLLTTVNKISTELANVSKQFEGLNRNLSSLSSKDFSLNFDFGFGNSSKNPEQAIKQLNMLKKEVEEYEKYFAKHYSIKNNEDPISRLLLNYNQRNQLYGLQLRDAMTKGSDVQKIAAHKEFLKLIKETAAIGNISLAPVEFRLAESGEFVKVRNEADETKKQLQELFSGGINAENLHRTLDGISNDLHEIDETLKGLSSGISVEGLTSSFDKLSETIEKLVSNVILAKNALNDTSVDSANISNQTKAAQETANAYQEAANEAKKLNNISIDISDNGIDELRSSLKKLGLEDDFIDDIINKLNKMHIVAKNVSGTIKGDNLVKFDIKGVQSIENGLERIVTLTIILNKDEDWDVSEKYSQSTTQAITADFEELKRLAKEISSLRIDIFESDDTADISRASAELEKLNNKYDELYAKTQGSLSDKQKTQLSNLIDQGDTKALNAFNNELNEFVKLQKQIENTRFEIGKLKVTGGKQNEIAELKRQLEELEDTYNKLMNTFMKKVSTNSDFVKMSDFSGLEKGIEEATRNAENRLERFKSQYADTRAELAKKIKVDIELGEFEDEISQIKTKFGQLSDVGGSLDRLRDDIKEVEIAYEAMQSAVDDESLIQSQKEYAAAIEKVNNQLKILASEQRVADASDKLKDNRASLKLDMLNWLKKNTKATKEYKGQIDALIASLDKLDQAGVNGVRRQFNWIDKDAELKGLKGLTAFDSIKNKIKEYSVYFSAAELFMWAEQGLRSMFEQVKLIDSAMTELKKVTDETDASYERFLTNAADRAREIGTTIDGLVSSTADFARLGYGFEDAQGLAEVANIYAVVGDEIDGVEGATESLISTMAAFKDEANNMSNTDFAMSIVDKFNEIGNNFAISSGGIGEALERSASSLDAANNTIDESIALITASNQVVQDPAVVGQALKTISMRIRGAKTE